VDLKSCKPVCKHAVYITERCGYKEHVCVCVCVCVSSYATGSRWHHSRVGPLGLLECVCECECVCLPLLECVCVCVFGLIDYSLPDRRRSRLWARGTREKLWLLRSPAPVPVTPPWTSHTHTHTHTHTLRNPSVSAPVSVVLLISVDSNVSFESSAG